MSMRRKLGYGQSQRMFSRHSGTHRYNLNTRPMRGGGRL